ncbi:hypothetical protein ACJIZ3_008759 [Penstemon smallii]|uniref:Replication factor A C-terminal domain-containing protein n=1 Tax=Penstemon smallii TaxID=265156 RepID=A0ABD3TBR1_9LAMI
MLRVLSVYFSPLILRKIVSVCWRNFAGNLSSLSSFISTVLCCLGDFELCFFFVACGRHNLWVGYKFNNVAESEGQVIDETDEAFPIIRATGLSVSHHKGGSLSSTPSTVILVNPQIPEAENLKTWLQKNLKFITHAISSKDHFAHSDSFFHVPLDKICRIADVVADNKVDKFLVKVQAMITDPDQKYFYMACEKCLSSVDADYDYQYTCVACKAFTHAKPRENIFDGSGSLDVTVFGNHDTELTEMAASRCMELYNEGALLPLETINQSFSGKSFIMKIRKRERSIGDSMQYQYVVLNMLECKEEDDIGYNSSTTNSKSPKSSHYNYLNST